MAAYSDGTATYAALAKAPDDPAIRAAIYDWWQEFDPARWEFVCVQRELEELEVAEHARVFGGSSGSSGSRRPHSDLGETNDLLIDLHNVTPTLRAGGAMTKCACRHCVLRRRESELLAAHRAEWLRVPCVKCGGDWQRGEGRSCRQCRHGDAGGLTWKLLLEGRAGAVEQSPVITFCRGLPRRVECPRLSDAVGEREESVYTGRRVRSLGGSGTVREMRTVTRTVPTPWLRAVTTSHPVEEVVPLDREPAELYPSRWTWGYRQARGDEREPDRLPLALFRRLVGAPSRLDEAPYPERDDRYDTREAAVTALGRALAAFGRA